MVHSVINIKASKGNMHAYVNHQRLFAVLSMFVSGIEALVSHIEAISRWQCNDLAMAGSVYAYMVLVL